MDRIVKINKNESNKKNNKTVASPTGIDADLRAYLNSLDLIAEPLDELAIAEKIKQILTQKVKVISNKLDRAEYIAFYFWPNNSDSAKKENRYYYPMMSGTSEDGQVFDFPDARHVDLEVIDYWKTRANESKHPSLTCRYADLALDFELRINNGKFDYKMAQKVIDATLMICKLCLDDGLGCKQRLERALIISKLISDVPRQKQVQEAIIETEDKFAEDDKPGLWGYGFKWLLLDISQAQLLNDEQKNKLLDDLNNRLTRLTNTENPSSWNVECAVVLLAKFYEMEKDEHKLDLLLQQLESAYRRNIHANSDGLLIVNYLEKLTEVYRQYGQYTFAKNAIQRIKSEMSNLGQHTKFDFHKLSVDLKIEKDDIENILTGIFGKKRNNKLESIRNRIAIYYIPRKDKVEEQLKEIAAKHVFVHLGNHSIISEDGFSLAKYGSIDEDFDRHLLNQFSQNLHFQTAFLHLALNELTKLKKPEQVYEILAKSPVFREEDKGYLMKVLSEYWTGDYLSSSCLMIPLIEDGIRNIYRLNNLSFITVNTDGGYDVKSLNSLLEEGLIRQIYGVLGDHLVYYLRVLLTERIGWNLRNNYAHGINKNYFSRVDVADRLLHVLFCLSLVRKVDGSEKEKSG